ncbi:MAG: DUF3667 domain-containing protein [Marinirhabdus sp.]|nr:DUF3667 domain-containing protein [Marinirhabdus sp.]
MDDKRLATSRKDVSEKNRKHFKYRGNKCLNCGQPLDLSDVYCPYCSQLNSTKQLSFYDFISEFLNSIVSYDSRLRYTVKDLLFKPGTITRRYVDGKRLRYANPFRFFLSVSIIYFLLNSTITYFSPESNPLVDVKENSDNAEAVQNAAAVLASNADNLSPEQQAVFVDSIQDEVQKQIAKRKSKYNADSTDVKKTYTPVSEDSLAKLSGGERLVERFSLYKEFYEYSEIKDASVALDSLGHADTKFNRFIYEKNKTIERIEEDPYGFLNYMTSKIPFFLFFFTPFFALFFWMVYSKRKFTYVEHMIFIFHIFSFLFLAMLIFLIPDLIIGNDIFLSVLFLLIGPFYFYKALRNFYKQSRIITILKFIFFNIVFLISANIAAILFFLVTAAVY